MSPNKNPIVGLAEYKSELRQKIFLWKNVPAFFEEVCKLALENAVFQKAIIIESDENNGKSAIRISKLSPKEETAPQLVNSLIRLVTNKCDFSSNKPILLFGKDQLDGIENLRSAVFIPIFAAHMKFHVALLLLSDQEAEFNAETEELLLDISYYLSYSFANLLEQEGKISALNAMDISERKFLVIFETVVDAIILITEKADILMFNSAAEKMFGYLEEEVTGKNVRILMPDPFHSEHDSYVNRYVNTLEKRIIGIGREVLAQKKDGHIFPIELAVSEVWLDGSRFFVGVIRDITRRKNAEDSLVAKNEELATLNKNLELRIEQEMHLRRERERILEAQSRMAAMGEMIGNIAHQWRQPLNAISILVQELEYTSLNDQLDNDYMRNTSLRIFDLLQSMSQTIDDFRNFYKPNKAKENFSLKNIIEKSLSLVSASMKHQNIRIETHFAGEDSAYGYPNELAQVLLNILSNAKDAILQHNPEEPAIQVKIYSELGKKIVSVKDNGGGFANEISEKIFLPYFSTKEQGSGVGLGLYMSKTIVEKNMGGRLSAHSDGTGAEFRIELP